MGDSGSVCYARSVNSYVHFRTAHLHRRTAQLSTYTLAVPLIVWYKMVKIDAGFDILIDILSITGKIYRQLQGGFLLFYLQGDCSVWY